MKAILFDLDQTLLDRSRSLLDFLHWQCRGMLRASVKEEDVEKFIHRFIELDANGMSPFQERNFRCLGLASFFQSVLVSQAVGLRKPDAKIFHLGCRELEVESSDAIYIGDHPISDIQGAKDAGLRTVFIPTALYPSCAISNAVCEDMKALPGILEKMR